MKRRAATGRRLRWWSAASSSGEEAYSLAMSVQSAVLNLSGWDVKILASDIDTDMVRRGAEAIYGVGALADIPEARRRFFDVGVPDAGRMQAVGGVRDLVEFKHLNLQGAWPMRGPMDIVFCRNVVIYFDHETQVRLFDRLADIMADDGYLYIGHSESLRGISERFKSLGKTVYRKVR